MPTTVKTRKIKFSDDNQGSQTYPLVDADGSSINLNKVARTGNLTDTTNNTSSSNKYDGILYLNDLPQYSGVPAIDDDLTNKKYVDDTIASGIANNKHRLVYTKTSPQSSSSYSTGWIKPKPATNNASFEMTIPIYAGSRLGNPNVKIEVYNSLPGFPSSIDVSTQTEAQGTRLYIYGFVKIRRLSYISGTSPKFNLYEIHVYLYDSYHNTVLADFYWSRRFPDEPILKITASNTSSYDPSDTSYMIGIDEYILSDDVNTTVEYL